MVNQGGKTCVQIWTSCNTDICHGEDGWAATTTVCPFQILLLIFLLLLFPFQLLLLAFQLQLLLLAKLMVIGCQPRPPDGGQAAIFETLEEKFLNMVEADARTKRERF